MPKTPQVSIRFETHQRLKAYCDAHGEQLGQLVDRLCCAFFYVQGQGQGQESKRGQEQESKRGQEAQTQSRLLFSMEERARWKP